MSNSLREVRSNENEFRSARYETRIRRIQAFYRGPFESNKGSGIFIFLRESKARNALSSRSM